MSFENAERDRMLGNLLKVGTIVSVDPAAARVVVAVDYGNGTITTPPIPWSNRAGKSKSWEPPAVGQQVMLASPGGALESSWVIASAYSAGNAAPGNKGDVTRHVFGDGSEITVDEGGALMTIKAAGDLTIECTGTLTLRGATLRLN